MRLDPHLGMLPERAFSSIGKRMTLEGGGGGGKGGGKGGSQQASQQIPYGGGMQGAFMGMTDSVNGMKPTNQQGGQSAISAVAPMPEVPRAQPAREADLVEALRARRRLSQSMGNFGGPNSTFLTGPTGVDPNTLSLGQTVLTGNNDTLGS